MYELELPRSPIDKHHIARVPFLSDHEWCLGLNEGTVKRLTCRTATVTDAERLSDTWQCFSRVSKSSLCHEGYVHIWQCPTQVSSFLQEFNEASFRFEAGIQEQR